MKNTFKTVNSIKNDCSDFADQVLLRDYSALNEQDLTASIENANNNIEIAALVKEIIFRKTGLNLFKCQLESAYALLNGHIAELATGEGKTLAGVVAAVMQVKSGHKVHVLVFNDYLAKRDAVENGEIFKLCGVTVGYITETTKTSKRKEEYLKDVLYISAREAGYDYIRNFVADSTDDILGSNYDVAIVDEADSILIDEASIPLILAGKSEEKTGDLIKVIDTVKGLLKEDYEKDEKDGQIWLNDSGIEKIEQAFLIENLYDDENTELLSNVNYALEALFKLQKDKDYIVRNGIVSVIDESTGRVALNRKFPNALHHFVELKEGITENLTTKIYCSITIGAFMEVYKTLSGMTGTAATSANELETTYGLRTIVVESHTPCIRTDYPDEIFLTNAERDEAALNEIIKANSIGQPVLIGTSSVKESEELSNKLTKHSIVHNVLNAKNDEKEAAVIAEAGKPYSVTVSTNMAGRGVDIKLGGVNEEEKDFVKSVGGLFVISTSINRSRRIDNQLKGRAGRQGDPGQSKFFISLEDETISPFFDEELKNKKLSSYKDKAALVRSAQITLEGNEAEARYTLKKYSYIIEHQRQIISKYRLDLLKGNIIPDILKENDFDAYIELENKVGKNEIINAEVKLLLNYINNHFSSYLESMEELKSGIHLTMVAGKNPFDEFNRSAIISFEEMNNDIKYDVLLKMKEANVVDGKISIQDFKLNKTTGTWTYMVDDSSGQFNHLPAIMNMVTTKIKEKISLSDRLDRFLNRKNKKNK